MAEVYADINPAVFRNVPTGSLVLDVGCGTGVLGKALQDKKHCQVEGIEYSPEAVRIARKRLAKVHVLDIEHGELQTNKKYDIIILADVLEHLKNPTAVLRKFLNFLKPNGKVIISLPNIANWTVRLKLLTGNFTRTQTGILDETHRHFYTLKTAKKFLQNNGLTIQRVDITPNFVRAFAPLIRRMHGARDNRADERILASRSYKTYATLVAPVETIIAKSWKKLFAYQFVFVCTPK